MIKHKPIFISQPNGAPGSFLASMIIAMLRNDEEIFEISSDGNSANYYIRYREEVMPSYNSGKPWDYSSIPFNSDQPIVITAVDNPNFESLSQHTDDYLHIRIDTNDEDVLWIYTNLYYRVLVKNSIQSQHMSMAWDTYKLLRFKKVISEDIENLEDLSAESTELLLRHQAYATISKPWKKLRYKPDNNHPHLDRCWDIAHQDLMFKPLEIMEKLETMFGVEQDPIHYYNYLRFLEYQQFFIRRQAPWLEQHLEKLQSACQEIERKYNL